ncbi:MAG: hypothetical protein HFG62_05545 [Lachnospiraceae bacterium]|jgi:dihydroorotase|nr:hypothetical protein [Lachnospiraceae bacterium]
MLNRYLIKNGTLMSILDGGEEQCDILVEDGRIARIARQIDPAGAEVLDAEGMYVSAGWLDAHCHFARIGDSTGIDPYRDLLCQGITYAVDLGTLGPDEYAGYRERFLYQTDLKFMSYLYIGHLGVVGKAKPRDFDGPEDIIPDRVVQVAKKYRHELLGLKARIDDKFCFDPEYVMNQLRALGDELDMPIAVHAPRSRMGIQQVLSYLKKGDVLCHTLAGNSDVMRVIDGQGHVKPCVLEARERGVIFDLSHGTNACSYDTAEAAWKAGFFTDTISSDLHAGNINGPVYNLGVVLSKIRGLTGKTWSWILHKTIAEPVRLQHIPNKAVEVREGMICDLTVFKVEEGAFTYLDSKKESRTFREKLTAVYTCTGPKVYVCR